MSLFTYVGWCGILPSGLLSYKNAYTPLMEPIRIGSVPLAQLSSLR